MKRMLPPLFGLLVLASLAGCDDEPTAPPQPRPVRSVLATPGAETTTLTQTGEIVPRRDVALGFRVGGKLRARAVDVGDTVAAGAALADIDPRDLDNQVRIAGAEVAAARAALSAASQHLDRQRKLAARDFVSKAAVEAAEADWQAASARDSAAQAEQAAAQDLRSYADLRAPEAGIVTQVLAQPGEVIAAGQPVLRLAAQAEREAAFDVSERLVAGAVPGLAVTITLVSDRSVTTQGVLREISPTADPATRTYRVRVALPQDAPPFAFGATVEGSVTLDLPGLVSLPATALTSAGDQPAVYVVDPATGKLLRKPVGIARYDADRILVADGLAPGDRVVTAGVGKLRPDQIVTLLEDVQ